MTIILLFTKKTQYLQQVTKARQGQKATLHVRGWIHPDPLFRCMFNFHADQHQKYLTVFHLDADIFTEASLIL